MANPCSFGTCVAMAREGEHYCPVHRPEAVLRRVRALVQSHFTAMAIEHANGANGPAWVHKIEKNILQSLDETV